MPDLGAVLALIAAAGFGLTAGMRIVARRRRNWRPTLLTPRLKHLRPTWGDRGFLAMPPVPARIRGPVQVAESSNADGPHLWISTDSDDSWGAELELDQAVCVAEQILALARWHYQIAPSAERQHVKAEAVAAGRGGAE